MSYQRLAKIQQSSATHQQKLQPKSAAEEQQHAGDRGTPFSASHIMQLQRSIGNRAVAQLFQSQTQTVQRKTNNTGMPDQLKSGIENLSGMSMDDVRVHYNSSQPAQLQALAYAQGQDIHVAPGQEAHLPHEAWHVVQQRQGRVSPTTQAEGTPINDDRGLEAEADAMGSKAMDAGASRMQMKPSAHAENQAGEAAASSDVVQKVAVVLYDGLDINNASTYDVGGGHSYADHGAHTTEEEQRERLKSGTAPSGRVSPVPPGKAASKFASDAKHVEAFKAAHSDLVAKNAPKQRLRGSAAVIDLAGAGVGYLRDGKEVTCDKVQLDIVPVDDKIRINSMYPV